MMTHQQLSRDEIAERYIDQLQYDLYPVQEEALFAWFAADRPWTIAEPGQKGDHR